MVVKRIVDSHVDYKETFNSVIKDVVMQHLNGTERERLSK